MNMSITETINSNNRPTL